MIINLWLNAFSFKKDSLRKPTLKRVFTVFIIIPLMFIHILLSRLLLILDSLFFYNYKNQSIDKMVFIVGVPRSGTSFLLELVANDKSNFTAFQLWELVFAPSIIQKKIILFLKKVLIKVGFPISTVINKINQVFFSKMNGIHDLKLNNFEEDELIYLYLFKSAYLMFLFPELEEIHQILIPDNPKNIQDRIQEQNFYKSLIKRHLYVFNKNNKRYFISKNPIHSIRLESLNTVFPTATYLNIQRPLKKTIPSTISLNLNLYRFCCSVKDKNYLRQKTIVMLLDWHQYVQAYYKNNKSQVIELDFKEMVKTPSKQAKFIHKSLGLRIDSTYENYLKQQDEFSKKYKSQHQYSPLTVEELKLIENYKP